MNLRFVLNLAGSVLKYEAYSMTLPLFISLYYKDNSSSLAFLLSIAVTLTVGFYLTTIKPEHLRFGAIEGFAGVAALWIALSFFGALPFYISGYFNGFIDSFFESVAAFTTAGTSVLSQTELQPRGLLFWRSFMQWFGGMGALIFVLAVMPHMGASALQFLRAESSGPAPEKLVPKIAETAKIMYIIYLSMTVALSILLLLFGLPLYDSIIHAFSTAATGGFSNRTLSVGAYNNVYVEVIITIFMFLFGVNFSLYYQLAKKNFKVFKDEEFLAYLGLTLFSIVIVTFSIRHVYESLSDSLRHASFQVSSLISTTGYFSTDYNYWPMFSKAILLFLGFLGGCAGSTSGGLKISRIIIMLKTVRLESKKVIRPRVVNTVKLNGKRIHNDLIRVVFLYFFLYVAIIAVATMLVSFDNKDFVSTFTAVIGAMSSVGHGFGIIGPGGDFSLFSPFSKVILSLCMITGRLEIFPMMILFNPTMWKKDAVI